MNAVPDEIDDMLRDAGIRVTQQRRTVIAALVQSHDHPSAHDVYTRAKLVDNSVSFATVYRALASLTDAVIFHLLSLIPFSEPPFLCLFSFAFFCLIFFH